MKRRTWDVEEYEQKAKARLTTNAATKSDSSISSAHHDGPHQSCHKRQRLNSSSNINTDDNDNHDNNKEEFIPAEPGAAGPQGSERAFLQPRKSKVDISSKVGNIELISAETAAKTSSASGATASGAATAAAGSCKKHEGGVTKSGVGWHCRVCDCFLKDSMTYLDHINGRKHQRNLGYSMRVERSTKDQMMGRLMQLTKEKEQKEKKTQLIMIEQPEQRMINYADIVKQKDQVKLQRKAEKAKRRREKKNNEDPVIQGIVKVDDDDTSNAAVCPDLAAAMGFSGFGGK